MMHGREKSDPAIVATKPPNGARTRAEEAGEPRAGAKGKAGQQSTRRALNRESVSQALDRLRQAARQKKKERFTALSSTTSASTCSGWRSLISSGPQRPG